MKLTIINELAKSYLFEYVSFCYDVVSSYIKANEQVREDLEDFYNTHDYKDRQEEINILRNIMRESEENQKEAEFFLVNYLEPSFPEIEKEVKTRKVSFFVLHSFKGNCLRLLRHHRQEQRERTAVAQRVRPAQPHHRHQVALAQPLLAQVGRAQPLPHAPRGRALQDDSRPHPAPHR